MHITIFNNLGLPLLIALGATIGLHLLGRIFFLSSHHRSRKLYEGTHWLPLRTSGDPLKGEKVEFSSTDRATLRGTFLRHETTAPKGTILFCHEFNGTQENIGPYVDQLTKAGFNILTFDFRNHGQSDFVHHVQPTPWVTTTDLDDVRAAMDYLCSRPETATTGFCVFGFGKGATVALCAAGSDNRIQSVVLDAPVKETKLFAKNCRDVLFKSMRLSRRRTIRFVVLFIKALLYVVTYPVLSAIHAWRRFVLGIWCGCRFVNPGTLAKKVRKPVMIIHGHVDSSIRADQVQALCNRMNDRPRLWFAAPSTDCVDENCSRQVIRFIEEVIG